MTNIYTHIFHGTGDTNILQIVRIMHVLLKAELCSLTLIPVYPIGVEAN